MWIEPIHTPRLGMSTERSNYQTEYILEFHNYSKRAAGIRLVKWDGPPGRLHRNCAK